MMGSLDSKTATALASGSHGDPFAFLGPHEIGDGHVIIRTFQADASEVMVVDSDTGKDLAPLHRIHPNGLFEGELSDSKEDLSYRLRVTFGKDTVVIEDPYRFGSLLGELDSHLIGEGNHLEAYKVMGAHLHKVDGVSGVCFAVWAPNARRVSIVGPFNQWDGRCHAMRKHHGIGVWELFVPGLGEGEIYKYEIKDRFGNILPLKSDPYAFRCEHPPATASIVEKTGTYKWADKAWMKSRQATTLVDQPISIYEVHLGSWRRVPDEDNRSLTYKELSDQLVSYVKDLGFTHIELLPITEHPFDGSWGYQPIGLFAPTSRFGTPDEFRYFVDRCHKEGIGVILDWVPGHFPTDTHGLEYFDGTHLYEHADPRQGRHMDWGTLIYNFDRKEVANFLLVNALFWINEYHLDGLRVDAVASMLYLDYSRKEGEWIPNEHGGRENLGAIAFLRRLNELVYERGQGAFTLAEESTAWPMVSRPTYLGGLGFGYKWNMGWMHDTLLYMSKDPVHRRYHHNDMTFGMLYAYSENYVLPLSHDEVVHGKGSLLGRMPGDTWQRFAGLRAYFGFMWVYPGKKLLFMGGEFGQEREWAYAESLDWHLLENPLHKGMQTLIADLNKVYREHPSLPQQDCEPEGFRWVENHDVDQSVFAYLRYGKDGSVMLVINSFTPVVRQGYRLGVPVPGAWVECVNTDKSEYGGSGVMNEGDLWTEDLAWHDQPYSLNITIPPLATVTFVPKPASASDAKESPNEAE
ncbi:1,4-alpha-glucan branching protein GlgB [Magnetospira sp. QH-2]|uniref:1,4-alpha-glucan branching protein GlgB n=1 Tax=Magnetospira sp. (strain QH-2) TaxID=1288970 RepID=UPI0005F9F2DA|nr:1,4-alpha-glucan branching protein GlgB [Magnetospira sp. QH-2]